MRWHKYLWRAVLIFVLIVFAGSFAYHYVEGLSMLDSVYFVVITLTTIGYGDLAPLTDAGKIFTIFFSFFGIAFAFYIFSMMGSRLFKEHLGRKVSEIKEETKEQEEIKKEIKEDIKEGIKESRKKTRKKK